MEEKDLVNVPQQNNLKLEFHIDSYEIKELYSSAFELIKRSFFIILLILHTLINGFYVFLLLLVIILNLLLGDIIIRYILLFCLFSIFVIPVWIAVEYKSVFTLRKTTKNLSIKIRNNSIFFSSEVRYEIVHVKDIKIKKRENGILLIFKRVNNQKKTKY